MEIKNVNIGFFLRIFVFEKQSFVLVTQEEELRPTPIKSVSFLGTVFLFFLKKKRFCHILLRVIFFPILPHE